MQSFFEIDFSPPEKNKYFNIILQKGTCSDVYQKLDSFLYELHIYEQITFVFKYRSNKHYQNWFFSSELKKSKCFPSLEDGQDFTFQVQRSNQNFKFNFKASIIKQNKTKLKPLFLRKVTEIKFGIFAHSSYAGKILTREDTMRVPLQ